MIRITGERWSGQRLFWNLWGVSLSSGGAELPQKHCLPSWTCVKRQWKLSLFLFLFLAKFNRIFWGTEFASYTCVSDVVSKHHLHKQIRMLGRLQHLDDKMKGHPSKGVSQPLAHADTLIWVVPVPACSMGAVFLKINHCQCWLFQK